MNVPAHHSAPSGALVFPAPAKAYVRRATAGGWEVAAPWAPTPIWCASWRGAIDVLDLLFRKRAAYRRAGGIVD